MLSVSACAICLPGPYHTIVVKGEFSSVLISAARSPASNFLTSLCPCGWKQVGEPWCRAGGGMPVDMFGQGPGRGPSLSHSCWVHRRGTVQRQGKPAATAGVLGSWVTGGGFLSNRPSRALPSSTVLPPGLSPEIIPVLSSRKCRGKA